MSHENVDALRTLYEHWRRGNFRETPKFDPHVVLVTSTDIPDADRIFGVDSLRAYMREYLSAFTDVTWAAEDYIEAEEASSSRRGNAPRGPGAGFRPTG